MARWKAKARMDGVTGLVASDAIAVLTCLISGVI
jgi:hypothetical protein